MPAKPVNNNNNIIIITIIIIIITIITTIKILSTDRQVIRCVRSWLFI